MPTWLTLVGAIFGTLGFFAAFYGIIITLVEGKRSKGKPRIGLSCDSGTGILGIWVNWKPETFGVEIYRLRFKLIQPEGLVKDAQFTITYDPPQKASFFQPVEFPIEFQDAFRGDKGGMVQVDFRTVEEFCMQKIFRFRKIRDVLHRKIRGPELPGLKAAGPDIPTVTSLDFSELQVRRKKIKDLEAAAKAKAAKAPPKPAAAAAPAPPVTTPPAAAPVPPAATVATPEAAKAPVVTSTSTPSTPPPAPKKTEPQDKPVSAVPSLKSVIAKENAKMTKPEKSNL